MTSNERDVKPLQEWREARYYTQAEVARAIGVAESSVRNWEKYGRKPRWKSLRELARFLGITPQQISFGGGDDSGPKVTAA